MLTGFCGETRSKKTLEIPRCRRKDNIKIDVRET
jgi:hypothetical protein